MPNQPIGQQNPTGGYYTINIDGQTTGPLPHNATAAMIDTALEALPHSCAGHHWSYGFPPENPETGPITRICQRCDRQESKTETGWEEVCP
jgi:hypothetical protein